MDKENNLLSPEANIHELNELFGSNVVATPAASIKTDVVVNANDLMVCLLCEFVNTPNIKKYYSLFFFRNIKTKQVEFECMYFKYLMILNMKHTLEVKIKADEDIAAVKNRLL
jgi:hypothetical protein